MKRPFEFASVKSRDMVTELVSSRIASRKGAASLYWDFVGVRRQPHPIFYEASLFNEALFSHSILTTFGSGEPSQVMR